MGKEIIMTNTNQPVHPMPPTLNHVIGQQKVVAKLKVAVEASFADGDPLPHAILTGPPGTGKTMLSQVLAKEMAGEFHEILGQTITSPQALNGFLMSPESANAILFIDECHEMSPWIQTALYKALEEGCVFLSNENQQQVQKLKLQPFTLILATTDPQRLLQPLRDRIKLNCQLRRYTSDDIQLILRQKISQSGWEVEDEVLEQIAVRSFGTPRLALRLMDSVRRTSRSLGETNLSIQHANQTFEIEEMDSIGLSSDESQYLSILSDSVRPMKLGVIASRLGQPPEAVARVVESNLIWLGFVDRSDQGRSLTPQGLEHVRNQSSNLSGQVRDGGQQ
tara:strand:- start:526 stop:1533 length:1008 start_codon:yes stop_codon:yes gene_type:complete